MDLPLTLAMWTGMALRLALGWLIACLRTRSLLPFDERQLPSLATVAALSATAGFISGWLTDPALQPNERLVLAVALGFFAQVIFRDSLKGLDQPQPLQPPTPLPQQYPLVLPSEFPNVPSAGPNRTEATPHPPPPGRRCGVCGERVPDDYPWQYHDYDCAGKERPDGKAEEPWSEL